MKKIKSRGAPAYNRVIAVRKVQICSVKSLL